MKTASSNYPDRSPGSAYQQGRVLLAQYGLANDLTRERGQKMSRQKVLQWGLGLMLVVLFLVGCGTEQAVPTPVSPTAAASQTVEAQANPTHTTIPGPKPTASPSGLEPWSLVAVGDSIPYNSSDDCPGCTSFVDRYAAAIFEATGHPVTVLNLSQHNGLQIDGLLSQLESENNIRREALADADIIVVGIAHNDIAWNRNDDPCDGPSADNPDWSKFNAECAAEAAEIFRPKFESVYSQIVALRAGKPTIFRTINRYNDWIGSTGGGDETALTHATRDVLDAWNTMICEAAQANDFACADIYHAFNGHDGLTPSPDLLAEDYVHPSDKGNEVIARVLADLGYAPLAPGAVTSTAASPTNAPAPTATITIAAPATELSVPSVPSVPSSTAETQFTGHTDRVRYASFSPDGKTVVTAGGDHTARLWDATTGKELLQFKGHDDAVECAIFSPDGKSVLTTSWDKTLRLWDVATGKQLLLFAGNNDVIRRAAFSPDGKYVVSTSDDGIARTWDAQTAKTIATYSGHTAGTHVNRVAFSPDGKTVATTGDDRTARIWDPFTGEEIMVFKGHTDIVAGVAFSPDGKNLVTSSFDGSVRLWDVASGIEVRIFAGHPRGGAFGAAFSPDGKYVTTSGADALVWLWDVQSGAEVRLFLGHTDAVRNVVFSPDSNYILTASDDNTARLWRTNITAPTGESNVQKFHLK